MISINEVNGKLFVWKADDVHLLRKDYRIIGVLIGCPPRNPFQNTLCGLPLQLSSPEAKLLIDNGYAKLVKTRMSGRSESDVKCFKEFREKLYHEQCELYKEIRCKEIYSLADKILEGKRRKLKKSKESLGNKSNEEIKCDANITREEVIREEINKIKPAPREICFIQLYTECPWEDTEEECISEWTYPNTDKEKLQYVVFCDLWKKGYYLTSAIKFGGDFLVYAGNPMLYHSLYIVVCLGYSETFTPYQLVRMGRVSTHVKKTLVLATLKPCGTVDYMSVKWTGVWDDDDHDNNESLDVENV